MSKPVELVVIGAGSRGASAYASYALRHPDQVRIVGVADPDPIRRGRMAEAHDLDDAQCFDTWEELIGRRPAGRRRHRRHAGPDARGAGRRRHGGRLRRAAGKAHGAHAGRLRATGAGGGAHRAHPADLPRAALFALLAQAARRSWSRAVWARSSPSSIARMWPTGTWRTASCAATGATRRLSSPMILAKCCHDLDVLVWNLGSPVKRLSLGRLAHALPRRKRRPGDPAALHRRLPHRSRSVPSRPSASTWTTSAPFPMRGSGSSRPALDPEAPPIPGPSTSSARTRADAGTPAGASRPAPTVAASTTATTTWSTTRSCCMELESGASVTLVMHGHSNEEHRSMRYDGTKATLRARCRRAGSRSTINDPRRRDEAITVDTERCRPRRRRRGHHGRLRARAARRDRAADDGARLAGEPPAGLCRRGGAA